MKIFPFFQRIPLRRTRPQQAAPSFPLYSPPSSTQNTTTSESTTEPESIVTNSSGTVVTRRYVLSTRKSLHPQRFICFEDDLVGNSVMVTYDHWTLMKHQLNKVRNDILSIDIHRFCSATSGSDNESNAHRRRSNKTSDSRYENNSPTLAQTAIIEQDENLSKSAVPIASSIPRKLASDLSHVNKLNFIVV